MDEVGLAGLPRPPAMPSPTILLPRETWRDSALRARRCPVTRNRWRPKTKRSRFVRDGGLHLIRHWFTGTTLIYHVATLRAAGGFDAAYGAPADLITALVVASQGGAAYSPEPFAAIRIHEDSFSARALNDVGGMEAMLGRLNARGPVQSPELFNAKFLRHTAWRFRFAVVRASGGAHLSQMGTRASGLKRLALICADRVFPSKLALARVALGYLIMRPFDILPTVWYRFSGWLIVRLRMLAHRRGAP